MSKIKELLDDYLVHVLLAITLAGGGFIWNSHAQLAVQEVRIHSAEVRAVDDKADACRAADSAARSIERRLDDLQAVVKGVDADVKMLVRHQMGGAAVNSR